MGKTWRGEKGNKRDKGLKAKRQSSRQVRQERKTMRYMDAAERV